MKNERSLRILMLEDNQDDIDLIERILRKDKLNFTAHHVDGRDEYIEAIRSFHPDVILSDHGLPQFNSSEALRICVEERPDIPFIIVTGTMSDEFAISILRNGADDYLLKSNLSRLPLAIHRAVKERRLEKLKREARHSLRKKNAELVKVNQELDNFMYSVSHNLRGPLASVLGLLSITHEDDSIESIRSMLSMMNSSVLKLDDTLKDILTYSRNARADIQSEDIEWKVLAEKSMEAVRYLKNFNHVKFDFEFRTAVPFTSDFHRLRDILISLLSNSIHFIDQKDPVISVLVESSFERAKIVIKDNGIGIRKECMANIFNMFYRGTEVSQGAGLGLYITREIIRKLKGDIIVTSEFGTGTIVSVTIPNAVKAELKEFPSPTYYLPVAMCGQEA